MGCHRKRVCCAIVFGAIVLHALEPPLPWDRRRLHFFLLVFLVLDVCLLPPFPLDGLLSVLPSPPRRSAGGAPPADAFSRAAIGKISLEEALVLGWRFIPSLKAAFVGSLPLQAIVGGRRRPM